MFGWTSNKISFSYKNNLKKGLLRRQSSQWMDFIVQDIKNIVEESIFENAYDREK